MKYFIDSKVVKERTLKKAKVDYRAIEPPSYHSTESKKASTLDDEA